MIFVCNRAPAETGALFLAGLSMLRTGSRKVSCLGRLGCCGAISAPFRVLPRC
jgi:hypothetical protein